MSYEIKQWAEIQDRFVGGELIVGNGGSIAVHAGFSYKNLHAEARRLGFLDDRASQVFRSFNDTSDFELVLRRLWHAKLVNEAMGLSGEAVDAVTNAYHLVREALIQTVRATHVSYDQATPHLEHIGAFIRQFRTVMSLNYDLIVYWAALTGEDRRPDDCFRYGRFDRDLARTRRDQGYPHNVTRLFYPHGNLVLARDPDEEEVKIRAGSRALLDSIIQSWESGRCVPVFVCEGSADKKEKAIRSSVYLDQIFQEVIPALGHSLVVYGWSLAEQERHIIDQMLRCRPHRVAISIYNEDREAIRRGLEIFEGRVEEIVFFRSDSPGAWNQPPS